MTKTYYHGRTKKVYNSVKVKFAVILAEGYSQRITKLHVSVKLKQLQLYHFTT